MLEFQLKGNKANQEPMANYMKNHFIFLGVKSEERKKQSKELIRDSKKLPQEELFELITSLYNREEREYQYVAIDICCANVKRMSWEELRKYAYLVEEKAWWDSVDAWRKNFGLLIKYQPNVKQDVFNYFYQHENSWMRRVSITLQLMEKDNTDVELLAKAIRYDLETNEFFIQKAIGWSLRQYSKMSPEWVLNFIKENELTPFAEKEALKTINKQS